MALFDTTATQYSVPDRLEDVGAFGDSALQRRRLHWLAHNIVELLEWYKNAVWGGSEGARRHNLVCLSIGWICVVRIVNQRAADDHAVRTYLLATISHDPETLKLVNACEPLDLDAKTYIGALQRRPRHSEPTVAERDAHRKQIKEWVELARDAIGMLVKKA